VDREGQITILGPTEVTSDKKLVIPATFKLEQNFPNPFNPNTSFTYQTGKASFVSIKIYNVLGQEVATLVNEVKQVGSYCATWNAAGMRSGIYFYKMQASSFSAMKKMLLLK
jgi:F0F1-type ATP synthase beta subunit